MDIMITGATGFIGRHLTGHLLEKGHGLTIVTRDIAGARDMYPDAAAVIDWEHNALKAALDSVDAVINLAGASIASGRWTKARRETILNSRLMAAQRMVNALGELNQRPRIFIQASAIGYYGHRPEGECTEESLPGEGFLAEVCRQWESHVPMLQDLIDRVVTIRIGVVLGRDGGMLRELLRQSKRCLAGVAGSGDQWISWIHMHDLVSAITSLLEDDRANGIFNLTAPKPVTQREFSRMLGEITGRKLQLGAPGFVIKKALGQFGRELLLEGQKVKPARLENAGFDFLFQDAGNALRDLLGKEQ